ncbi:MAG TPA: ABC transporter substrate-binding protein [Jatrophihabitans sp.]
MLPGVITAACADTATGTITLGNVGPYSATGLGQIASSGRNTLNVWAAYVNAHGGICGRKVQMLIRDDQGNASQHAAQVKDLVENQHVVALVGEPNASSVSAEQSYLESKGVPVIGGDIATGVWYKSPDYFPQGAQDNEILYALFKAAQSRPNGNKIAFLYCAEVVTCSDSYHNVVNNHIDQLAGSQVVYSKEDSLTQISFAAECQAAQQAGAGTMLAGGDSNFVEHVANSCGQQGLKFVYIVTALSIGEDQKSNQYLNNNLITVAPIQIWTATNTPGVQAFHQAISQFGPGVEQTGGGMAIWVSAMVAQQALTTIGGGAVTPASVTDALHKIKDFTAGGSTGPLTFHPGAQSSGQCTGMATLQNGAWAAANGGSVSCRSGAPLPMVP